MIKPKSERERMNKNPREAAFLALQASQRGEKFIEDYLEIWQQQAAPTKADFHLARQLAIGTTQRMLTLDYLATKLADKKKLSLKTKERLLLRLAIYQYYFLERIPLYALTDEMVSLAKKYCHRLFSGFLNATLRKLPEYPLELPSGYSVDDLSIYYSYPSFYIEELLKVYGLQKTVEVLEIGNRAAPVTFRLREHAPLPSGSEIISERPFSVGVIKDNTILPSIANSSGYYIQNITPATLIGNLCEEYQRTPHNILDLCASPGGKLLAAHDFFPDASLYGNDLTESKLKVLSENCLKYSLKAHLTCSSAENYASSTLFDIIILDVPCSNTGVLNKRPEARWRLTKQTCSELSLLQEKLLTHASTLLSNQGELWYMTCSILPEENEEMAAKACQKLNLQVKHQKTILPNREGWDGGYACSLTRKVN
jgi:16S rRNA (cytosine967-C5)-methyltransferase